MSKAKDESKEEAKALPEVQSKDAAGELKDAQLDAVAGGIVFQDGLANPLGAVAGPSPHMRGAGPHVGGYGLKVGSKVEGKH